MIREKNDHTKKGVFYKVVLNSEEIIHCNFFIDPSFEHTYFSNYFVNFGTGEGSFNLPSLLFRSILI